LENLRFEPGEEQNDDRFAQKLAMIGDFYVNDAFGLVHRAHASVHALAKLFHHKEPSNNKAFAGLLIEQESAALDVVLDFKSKTHSVAVLGGSKVSDKIVLIDQLARRSKNILVGGAMGYTLMRAKRIEVGNSRVENDKLSIARQVLETCEKMKVNLHLPIDHVCKSNFDENEEPVLVNTQEIPEGLMGLDIGPKTRAQYTEIIRSAQCVFWNGPMGVFEWEGTAEGTRAVGLALNECTKNGGYTVIGGGDSAAAANQMGLTEHISHVSTGGGASLTYLEQNGLPGLEFLEQKKETIHD
jgi:phosphoglycerate kinase